MLLLAWLPSLWYFVSVTPAEQCKGLRATNWLPLLKTVYSHQYNFIYNVQLFKVACMEVNTAEITWNILAFPMSLSITKSIWNQFHLLWAIFLFHSVTSFLIISHLWSLLSLKNKQTYCLLPLVRASWPGPLYFHALLVCSPPSKKGLHRKGISLQNSMVPLRLDSETKGKHSFAILPCLGYYNKVPTILWVLF